MSKGNGGMPQDDDASGEKLIFAAELFPHRSLGRKGFQVLLLLFGLLCLFHGGLFMLRGAWPVSLFLGADLLLIVIAFRINYRAGRVREEVRVSRSDVAVRRILPSGRTVEMRFNPFWLHFEVRREPGIGIRSMQLSGEGRQEEIGAFLNAEDRESFARAFSAALATATRRI